ncbi:MAG: hypothetical protein WDW36_001794 [Sanguina aurantia]
MPDIVSHMLEDAAAETDTLGTSPVVTTTETVNPVMSDVGSLLVEAAAVDTMPLMPEPASLLGEVPAVEAVHTSPGVEPVATGEASQPEAPSNDMAAYIAASEAATTDASASTAVAGTTPVTILESVEASTAEPVAPAAAAAAFTAAAAVSAAAAAAAAVPAQAPELPYTEIPSPAREERKAETKHDMFASQELAEELQETSQMGRRGEAWVLAQAAAICLLIFPPVAMVGLVDLLGTLAITTGAGFFLYALLSLGRNFSPMAQPRRNHTLVTAGMYSHARHPMYSGLIMIAFGIAAVTLSEARLALAALLWWVLEQKAAFEEAALHKLYPEYKAYSQSTAKFIPYLY